MISFTHERKVLIEVVLIRVSLSQINSKPCRDGNEVHQRGGAAEEASCMPWGPKGNQGLLEPARHHARAMSPAPTTCSVLISRSLSGHQPGSCGPTSAGYLWRRFICLRMRIFHQTISGVMTTVGRIHASHTGLVSTFTTNTAVTVLMVPASILVKCRLTAP